MKIERIYVNHIQNPLGFEIVRPVISWTVTEAAGTHMSWARVLIAEDKDFQKVVYDSGKRSDLNPLAHEADFQPMEATRYYVRVLEEDDTGDAGEGTGFFETAKDRFEGIWIQAPDSIVNPMFMKKFETDSEVASARLYISGLGLYEAYINGRKVGNEYLAPFYNDYNHWIQYQTYDVTDLICKGENAVGVILGNGWYMGRFGFIDKLDKLYGDTRQFIMDLVVKYKDGTNIVVRSDETFLTHKSPFLKDSIYDGEVYDSRKEVPGFSEASCSLAERNGWIRAIAAKDLSDRLKPRLSPRLVLHEEMKPVSLIHTPAGETVLDFGQEMVGLIRMKTHATEGTKIHLQFGEILQNGNFYNENLRTAEEELIYYSDGNEKEYQSHFTFYGFRYVKVSGLNEIHPEDFSAFVLYSEMRETGSIETDRAEINRLFLNAMWGQKGNFVDVPTDCPQRDERMGWTGDANVFCGTASFNQYTPAFYRKYLRDMLYEQNEKENAGCVPHVVPDVLDQINRKLEREEQEIGEVPEKRIRAVGSCAWGDAAVFIPWTQYVFFGDDALLNEEYANMKAWVDWIRKTDIEQNNSEHLFQWGFHFGDWLALDNYHKGSSFGGTDNSYVASAYYLYSCYLTARAAEALGKREDAEKYDKYAEDVRTAMQREFFTASGRCACDTQTALVLAIYFNIVSGDARKRAIRDLRKKIENEKMHLTTGFVGTAYLCKALSEAGLTDIAYTLLLNEDYPSWLYEVKMGATTIWERWNSVLPDGRVSDTGMNSLNHYAYGSIVEWMYRYMGGINPDPKMPGFKRFRVAPEPDERFKWCRTVYDSPYGKIYCAWKKDGDGWKIDIEVPFDTECIFATPKGAEKTCITSHGDKVAEITGVGTCVLSRGAYCVDVIMSKKSAVDASRCI